MTTKEFIKATGHEPHIDDLDRCNCKEAGSRGHMQCGVCQHGNPVFMCKTCCEHPTEIKRIPQQL